MHSSGRRGSVVRKTQNGADLFRRGDHPAHPGHGVWAAAASVPASGRGRAGRDRAGRRPYLPVHRDRRMRAARRGIHPDRPGRKKLSGPRAGRRAASGAFQGADPRGAAAFVHSGRGFSHRLPGGGGRAFVHGARPALHGRVLRGGREGSGGGLPCACCSLPLPRGAAERRDA